uniref:Uncharacterized protein n=1 Tax=Meloidogyne javanica TaxID=6303 RepID=A0A915MNJ3_MELJA
LFVSYTLAIFRILLKDRVSGDGLTFLMNDVAVQEPILKLKFAQNPIQEVKPIGTEFGFENFEIKENKEKCGEIEEIEENIKQCFGQESKGFRMSLNADFWSDYFKMSKNENRIHLKESLEMLSKYRVSGTETGHLPLEPSAKSKGVLKEEYYEFNPKNKKSFKHPKGIGSSSSSSSGAAASAWWRMEGKNELNESDLILFESWIVPLINEMMWNEFRATGGSWEAQTDALLFGLLFQFFQLVLNLDLLATYFAPIPGYYDPSLLSYSSDEVTFMRDFVTTIQNELGWKGKFRPTTETTSSLNFEKDYEGREKYEGPFQIKTDSLYWLPNLFNKVHGPQDFEFHSYSNNKELFAFIVKKLKLHAEKEWNWNSLDFQNLSIPLIHWVSAYLCDIGKETDCGKIHKDKGKSILDHLKNKKLERGEIEEDEILKDSINSSKNSQNWEEKFEKNVGNIVYLAIIEFNEEIIANNVKEAVMEAMKDSEKKVSDPIMIPK